MSTEESHELMYRHYAEAAAGSPTPKENYVTRKAYEIEEALNLAIKAAYHREAAQLKVACYESGHKIADAPEVYGSPAQFVRRELEVQEYYDGLRKLQIERDELMNVERMAVNKLAYGVLELNDGQTVALRHNYDGLEMVVTVSGFYMEDARMRFRVVEEEE